MILTYDENLHSVYAKSAHAVLGLCSRISLLRLKAKHPFETKLDQTDFVCN
jgi:hypothetical protein